jgi:hypothetical protein
MFRGPIRRGARRVVRRTTRRAVRRSLSLIPGRRYRRRSILFGGAMLLLVGGVAYKIGQSEARRIQQYTGRPPEDLSKEELENAMDDLGIQDQELTAADKAAIEAEAAPASAQPAAPEGSVRANSDYIAELERLADLRDRGIITLDDYEDKKKKLLGL